MNTPWLNILQTRLLYQQWLNDCEMLKSFPGAVVAVGTARSLEHLQLRELMYPELRINVKKLHPDAIIPYRVNDDAAGYELCALEDGKIYGRDTAIIKTGISMQIPRGFKGIIQQKSGRSLKNAVILGGGLIDSDYRGDIGIIVHNFGPNVFQYKKGEKIAQFMIEVDIKVEYVEVQELTETQRGEGGYGSTGIHAVNDFGTKYGGSPSLKAAIQAARGSQEPPTQRIAFGDIQRILKDQGIDSPGDLISKVQTLVLEDNTTDPFSVKVARAFLKAKQQTVPMEIVREETDKEIVLRERPAQDDAEDMYPHVPTNRDDG